MTRRTRLALVFSAAVLVALTAVCFLLVTIGKQIPGLFGCTAEATPLVNVVEPDPGRVHELLPRLDTITEAHWQQRETRVHLCPDLNPMTYRFDGYAVLPADYRNRYPWLPATPPPTVPDLTRYAPTSPSWTDASTFDAEMGPGEYRFDTTSDTLFFSILRAGR